MRLPLQFASQATGTAIPALSSLTRHDADEVRAILRAAAFSHAVEEHDDYDGYLSLLLTPVDESLPSYLVAGHTGAIELAEVQGDDMSALGTFATIAAAMAVLQPVLHVEQRALDAS